MDTLTNPSAKLRNLAISESGFVFSPSTGNTFVLNETGTFVLKKLMQGISREALITELLSTYTVSQDQAERDLSDLLVQMKEMGILD